VEECREGEEAREGEKDGKGREGGEGKEGTQGREKEVRGEKGREEGRLAIPILVCFQRRCMEHR